MSISYHHKTPEIPSKSETLKQIHIQTPNLSQFQNYWSKYNSNRVEMSYLRPIETGRNGGDRASIRIREGELIEIGGQRETKSAEMGWEPTEMRERRGECGETDGESVCEREADGGWERPERERCVACGREGREHSDEGEGEEKYIIKFPTAQKYGPTQSLAVGLD